jgi:hypothetical protein
VRRTTLTSDLRATLSVPVSNSLQRSDLGLLGRKSDGSSAVPEHPQSQVRITQSNVLQMKPIGANISARIVGLDPLPVKAGTFMAVLRSTSRGTGAPRSLSEGTGYPLYITATEAVLGLPVVDFQSASHQMRDQMPVSPQANSEDSKSAIGNLPAAPCE